MAGTAGPPTPGEDTPMPAWVYISGALLIVIALAFVAMHLIGGGIPSH